MLDQLGQNSGDLGVFENDQIEVASNFCQFSMLLQLEFYP
jgi:hypothetical protein